MTRATILGGTLERVARDQWQWRDGAPAPQVRDLRPNYNFRCRTEWHVTASVTYVEVLATLASEQDDLRWVLARGYRTGESGDHTGPMDLATGQRTHIRPGDDPLRGHPLDADILPGRPPTVILVPWGEWDAHWRDHPAGAEWALDAEADILSKAYALGWRPPHGYISRAGWRAPEGPR